MFVYDDLLKKTVPQIDEMDVVSDLRKFSPEFNRFYNEERIEKLGEVLWRIDPAIGTINKMRSITIKDASGINCPIIYMNDACVSIDDVFIVAHEIMHCVLTEEGKSLKIWGTIQALASGLQTMLEDSVVDSILQNKYGFDVLEQYKKGLDFP